MIAKKQRDVKFMIYLGLYLFVIAFITIQGATLVDVGTPPDPRDTSLAKVVFDSIQKLPRYDTTKEVVLRKPGKDSLAKIVPKIVEPDAPEISPDVVARLKSENAQLRGQNSALRNENDRLKKRKSVDD